MGGTRNRWAGSMLGAVMVVAMSGCGGSSGPEGSSDTTASSSLTTTTSTPAKVALPSDPCDMLKDDEVAEIMGWPDNAGVQGEPPSSVFGGEDRLPSCTWAYTDYAVTPPEVSTLNLSTGTWASIEEDLNSNRAEVDATDDERIQVMTYSGLDTVAMVRLGDQGVMVAIVDDTQRADPVDVGKQLLDAYSG